MSIGFRQEIERARLEHHRLIDAVLDEQLDALGSVAEASATALDRGGKLLFFGNGGSAAQAQEMAGEFVNRYSRDRRALAAVALTVNTSVLTSIGNDLEFAEVFSRQIEALGQPEDLAIGISTSGASENVVRGLARARAMGLVTAALVGSDGGRVGDAADLIVRFPTRDTARIQEAQMFAGHVLCRWVEHHLGLTPELTSTRSEQATCPERAERVERAVKLPAES